MWLYSKDNLDIKRSRPVGAESIISSHASGACWSLTHYCPWPNILPNVPTNVDYQPGFTAKMMLKDLQLSQDAAANVHAKTPLGKHAMDLYRQFVVWRSYNLWGISVEALREQV